MIELKLGGNEEPQGDPAAVGSVVNLWLDWAARAAILVTFAALVVLRVAGISQIAPLNSAHKLLMVVAGIANVMFLSLVALTALTRLAPIRKSQGIEPRLSALLGTFLSMALSPLPQAELGAVLSVASSALIIVGASLSFVVLRWLGKSFSIMAEARRLVTAGPYRFVRHPLYICEGIVLVGVVLQVLSPLAFAIAIVIAAIQYRRMINEEAILSATFPEYRAYAAQTPRLIPARLISAWLAPFYSGSKLPGKSC